MSTEDKAIELYNAIKNEVENDLIELIMNNSRNERVEIKKVYEKKYGELAFDVNHHFGGEFKNIVNKLFLSRAELDTEELIKAFSSFSTDDDTIYDILLNRPQEILNEIKDLYKEKTGVPLETAVNRNLDKCAKEALLAALKTKRNDNPTPSNKECEKLAALLVKEEPKDWLSNKKIINEIIAQCSPQELVQIARFYKEKTGTHIQNKVDALPKNLKAFLTSFFFNAIAPAEHYAYSLYQSLKGIGTNNQLLDRILCTRYDLDMPLIKKFYEDIYKVSAQEDIEDDTSGSYRKLLLELLNYMPDEN